MCCGLLVLVSFVVVVVVIKLLFLSFCIKIYFCYPQQKFADEVQPKRWPNIVCARFTDSVSDVIKRARVVVRKYDGR